jgi:hypothetical protein
MIGTSTAAVQQPTGKIIPNRGTRPPSVILDPRRKLHHLMLYRLFLHNSTASYIKSSLNWISLINGEKMPIFECATNHLQISTLLLQATLKAFSNHMARPP